MVSSALLRKCVSESRHGGRRHALKGEGFQWLLRWSSASVPAPQPPILAMKQATRVNPSSSSYIPASCELGLAGVKMCFPRVRSTVFVLRTGYEARWSQFSGVPAALPTRGSLRPWSMKSSSTCVHLLAASGSSTSADDVVLASACHLMAHQPLCRSIPILRGLTFARDAEPEVHGVLSRKGPSVESSSGRLPTAAKVPAHSLSR